MVARQVDVFPAKWRQVLALRLVQIPLVPPKRTNRPFQVHRVPEHDVQAALVT